MGGFAGIFEGVKNEDFENVFYRNPVVLSDKEFMVLVICSRDYFYSRIFGWENYLKKRRVYEK